MQEYLRSFCPFGARFRRETPVGPYVVDFAWLSARIVIEVDGATHDEPGAAEHDAAKDRFLKSRGFKVIRVGDGDAIANLPSAYSSIEEALRPHLSHPSPSPSPQGELCSLQTALPKVSLAAYASEEPRLCST